jgi:hypothetical protein
LAGLTVTAPITGSVTGSSGSTTGNAATATALQTSRNINGTAFNGTADITVTAAAGTLTGATLASGVTASSLTSVGTLTSLAVSGSLTTPVTITSSGASTSVAINNTNVNAWGSNLAIQTGGTPAGYFGTIGSLLGNTTQDLTVYATSGNGFRVYTNGNNLRLQVDSTGNLAVDTSTLYVDATNNRVGVGTATPGDHLEVLAGFLSASDAKRQRVRLRMDSDVSRIDATFYSGASGAYTPLAFSTSDVERMRIDTSGNLGLGVTPSAWASSRALDFGGTYSSIRGSLASVANTQSLVANAYYDGAWKYVFGYNAQRYTIGDGSHSWHIAPSGTAGAAISFTQAMTLDASGNLGIGVTPSAWTNSYKGIELSGAALTSNDTTSTFYLQNAYVNGGQFLYKASAFASAYGQSTGVHAWYRAPSGTAGNAITFTQAMTLDASGNLGVGTATPAKKLDVTVATAASLAATDDGLRVLNATARAALGVTGSSYVYGGAGADAALLYSLSRLSIMADTANPITFHTGTAAPVERMRLDSTGNLGIGGTPGAYRLDVVGSMRCYGDVLSSATSVSTFGTLTNQSLRLATNNTFRVNIDTSGNVCLNTSSVGTSAVGVLGIANGTAPSSSPAGMGQLYVEAGALKYRGSSGTVTTIANA